MHLTALIVASAFFMEQLDATILSTALPRIAGAMHVSPLQTNILLTAYLLSLTVFIPASGQLADRFGARQVFCAAIAVFTAASVLCAQAGSLESLAAYRFLQGIGGAMMVPVGRLVVLRSVKKSELVTAMSWVLMPAMVAPVVGPPLGGFIVTHWSWSWIFIINLPIGLVGMALAWRFIGDVPATAPRRLDIFGQCLSSVALCSLVGALETLDAGALGKPTPLLLLGASVVAGTLYVRHARRHPTPALDLRLLRIVSFQVAMVPGTLFRIGIGALPFLLPMMLQIGFGLSPIASGLLTLSSALAGMSMKLVTVPILRRTGFRQALIWNGAIVTLFLCVCAAFRPSWPTWLMYMVLLSGGFSRSLQFNIYGSLAFADIPPERMSAASSFYSTMQQLSTTIGVALAAATLQVLSVVWHHPVLQISDFTAAFLLIGAVTGLAVPLSRRLPHDAGAEMSGHQHSQVPLEPDSRNAASSG